jgi:hypothetical protein
VRPILHGDVSNAARALLRVPAQLRADLCDRMIAEAEAAYRHAQSTRQMHPLWGNGSLMSAARKRPLANEPGFDDVDYCGCFSMVLEALIRRQISPRRS